MIMIPGQKCTHLSGKGGELFHPIGGPPHAFLPQSSVETLNVRLLILLVGAGDTLPRPILEYLWGKHAFEFWPALGLDVGIRLKMAEREKPDRSCDP